MTADHPLPGEVNLHRLAQLVRQAVLDHYPGVRTCIETVRVAVEVGRYFGLRIEPVPLRVTYATPDWWEWPADDKANAPGHSVGTGGTGRTDPERNVWDGHLAGYVPTATTLVDLSADQYHRPAKGLVIAGPLHFPVTRAQLAAGVTLTNDRLRIVCQLQEIPDRSWRRAGAWTKHRGWVGRVAAEAIRAVRAAPTGSPQ